MKLGVRLAILCFVVVPTIVFAGNKQYPVEGTVITVGTNQEMTGGDKTVFTHLHRTYTVKTTGRIFVFECPFDMNGVHIMAPSECGGKKKIEIGDTIHFRVEKRHACLQTDKGKEQKLGVLSESLSEDSAQAAKP